MANIYLRGNVWYVDYRVGGVRHRKAVGKKRDAVQALRQINDNLQMKRTQRIIDEITKEMRRVK